LRRSSNTACRFAGAVSRGFFRISQYYQEIHIDAGIQHLVDSESAKNTTRLDRAILGKLDYPKLATSRTVGAANAHFAQHRNPDEVCRSFYLCDASLPSDRERS
jgi:hypothetical protein